MTDISADLREFEAPYLIEKLLKDHMVDTPEEGALLFREVKRWLALNEVDKSQVFEMYSIRVDEVWHQFILYTHEYMEFCQRFFGRYLPHCPSNAPEVQLGIEAKAASFAEFSEKYGQLYGCEPPEVWFDHVGIRVNQRSILTEQLWKILNSEKDEVTIADEQNQPLVSISRIALPALEFIKVVGAFYIRELPGGLSDEEKITICSLLIEYGLLRFAA